DGHTLNIPLGPEQFTFTGTRVEGRQYLAPDSLSGTRSLHPLILSGRVFQEWARPHPGPYLPAITR
ncbi:MAG: hypothetical protein KAS80_06680, partial [Anaerolineales bacterium]|nr:hypothetical protein [Anaerolineales bacterium]